MKFLIQYFGRPWAEIRLKKLLVGPSNYMFKVTRKKNSAKTKVYLENNEKSNICLTCHLRLETKDGLSNKNNVIFKILATIKRNVHPSEFPQMITQFWMDDIPNTVSLS